MRLNLKPSKTKIATSLVLIILLVGLSTSISLDTFAGEVVKAILTGNALSSRWVGLSGVVDGTRVDSTKPFYNFSASQENAGEVTSIDFRGNLDGRHYFAAIPYTNGSDFDVSKLSNASLTDMQARGLFKEDKFPIFYQDSVSYSAMSDSPEETFTKTGNLTLIQKEFEGPKAILKKNVPTYVLEYDIGGEKVPAFFTAIDEYSNCYDGSKCNYEFLLPNIQGNNYYIYMIPESRPINITTYINGEKTNKFEYAGRPYRVNITTRSIFKGNSLVNRTIELVEREGNNLFTPAIGGDSYTSESRIRKNTTNGTAEIMFSPTKYNSPDKYNLSVRAYSKGGHLAQVDYLSVENGNIKFTDKGPKEIGMPSYEKKYKKGVNRLRPIASCMFSKVSNEQAYRLDISSSSDSNFTLVRGIPYIVNIEDSSISKYRLEEPGSHLVMTPAQSDDFGKTIHIQGKDRPYLKSDEVIFTPTVPSSKDEKLEIELLGSQDNIIYRTNLSVKGSTCGNPQDGVPTFNVPNIKNFKKRVNSIRPVLNSLFVAGS